jgi:hypothetical protein
MLGNAVCFLRVFSWQLCGHESPVSLAEIIIYCINHAIFKAELSIRPRSSGSLDHWVGIGHTDEAAAHV